MARISSFQPLRYNPDLVPDPGAVIAPPYDAISAEKRQGLVERDPRNVIRLILPEGDDPERYGNAARLLDTWRTSGVLIPEKIPAIYPYTQRFDHPATGERIERRGFIAAVGLEPFSAGTILPHERTLSGPKQDRLKLMEATDADLEPIFGIYRDGDGSSSKRLGSLMETREPLITATDSDGVEHILWRLADPAEIDLFAADIQRSVIFIVDGHHRYETAMSYQAERHAANAGLPPGSPVDTIMMFLAPTSDPGLLILPTHRVVHGLPRFDFDWMLANLGSHFEVTEPASPAEGLAGLESAAGRPAYLLLSQGRSALLRLRPDVPPESIITGNFPQAVRELDVAILHEHVLEGLLGITKEAQAEQRNLRYVKSAREAFDASWQPDVQLVAVMNATRLDQVERVAESGEVMPQKSTYFYPKLASGLLFYPLDSHPALPDQKAL